MPTGQRMMLSLTRKRNQLAPLSQGKQSGARNHRPMNFVAFDIETVRLTPDGEDWHSHRPLGISCYALAWRKEGSIQSVAVCGRDDAGNPQPQMSRAECCALVEELADYVQRGFIPLTWNGLSFDFNILAEESGMHNQCCELARAHVDMMFHFFCLQGYPLGLDAAAKGMGLAGKLEGMDGAQAPILWQQAQFAKVLEYVTQDAITTLNLAEAVVERKRIRWQTRGGKPNRISIPKWLTVVDALKLPLPNTSWMRKPLTRAGFTAWMDAP